MNDLLLTGTCLGPVDDTHDEGLSDIEEKGPHPHQKHCGQGSRPLGKRKFPGAASEPRRKKIKVNKKIMSIDVQAAYYGIELLRARWDRTHSIVLVVEGKYVHYWH